MNIEVRDIPFTEIVAMKMSRASRINYYSGKGFILLFTKQKFDRKKKIPPCSYSPQCSSKQLPYLSLDINNFKMIKGSFHMNMEQESKDLLTSTITDNGIGVTLNPDHHFGTSGKQKCVKG